MVFCGEKNLSCQLTYLQWINICSLYHDIKFWFFVFFLACARDGLMQLQGQEEEYEYISAKMFSILRIVKTISIFFVKETTKFTA